MKVVNQNELIHTISVIPRFNETVDVSMIIIDESTKLEEEATNFNYILADGIGVLEFDNMFIDKNKYSFKLMDGTKIIYRGRLITTTQETQNYKLTKELYFYE